MKVKNISSKIIGIGEVTILPGETKEIPSNYEGNPTLDVYKTMKMVEISGKKAPGKSAEEIEAEKKAAEEKAAAEAEALRLARLESLKDISEEDLAKLANELGINPAECNNQTDVKKKVTAALKK